MLGDLIYENKGKITGQRVLDVSGPRIETSFSATGTLKGGSTLSEIGTYWMEARSPGVLYGEGQGVIMTSGDDGNEFATWKGSAIGRMSGSGRISFRGAIYWSTSSTGKLSPLNNVVGVFEYETDEGGNTSAKIWEWK